ncbi:MAG: hypothetical protein SAJ72_17235 [Jaaginema sp. PMC 1080.18]|nr:hypothetical protein [Jaaginema sp. PMC 1080.18]MEC4867176.1 hypothetical protein [Jaaginema sp. PMC 1078.18]
MKKKSFRLSHTVESDSYDDRMISFLDELEFLSRKEAVMKAIRSYWLPLALENGELDSRSLEKVGYEAVLDLLKQANYICAVLKLDRNQLGMGLAPFPGTMGSPSPSEKASSIDEKKVEKTNDIYDAIRDYKYEDLGFDDWPKN